MSVAQMQYEFPRLQEQGATACNLRSALLASRRQTQWGAQPDPVAVEVLGSPSFGQLVGQLSQLGLDHFAPLNGGFTSIVLRVANRVVRLGLGALARRPAIEEVLQADASGCVGSLRYEVLPLAETADMGRLELASVLAALERKGYRWGDAGVDNIGRVEGRLVVLDADGIERATAPSCGYSRRRGDCPGDGRRSTDTQRNE